MPRILKSSYVVVDNENRVKINVNNYANMFQSDSMAKHLEEEEVENNELFKENQVLDQAQKGAELIIREAKKTASEIVEQAKRDAEEIALQIKEESQQEGYEQGYALGEEKSKALIEEAEQIKENAIVERKQMLESVEGEVLELIVKLLHKLLTNTIHINPQVIMVLIRAGLASTNLSGESMVIRVSSDDYEMVNENKEEILRLVESSSQLDILKDLSLKQGDCIIETPFGNIDCSLDHQVDDLVKNLYYVYKMHALGDEIDSN